MQAPQILKQLQAAAPREIDIHQGYVTGLFLDGSQPLAGVRSFDQDELRKGAGENAAQAPAEQVVIVYYEDTRHSSAQNFVSLAARGKRSVTRVPLG